MQKKILVIGNPDVGKTSLIKSVFKGEAFDENIQPTRTINYFPCDNPFGDDDKVKLTFWDLTLYKDIAHTITDYTGNTVAAILVYDLSNLNSLKDLVKYAEGIKEYNLTIANATVSIFSPLYRIMLVGTKADLKEERQVNSEDVKLVKTQIAHTIGINPTAIQPLRMSAKVPFDREYNNKENLKNELIAQLHMTENDIGYDAFKIKNRSSDGYYEFADDDDTQTCAFCTCVCCLIKYCFIWGLLGCVGAALGAIVGVLAKYEVIGSFHINQPFAQISLKKYSTLQRASIIGAVIGLGAGLMIILAYLLYCNCCRKKPARGESYSHMDSNGDDIKNESQSYVSTPTYD